MDFSLIVPCYNEEGNLDRFFDEVVRCLRVARECDGEFSFELVFVDDGSGDSTLDVLRGIASRASRGDDGLVVRVIGFSRNFGKEAAMLAGLRAAEGDFLGFIDADLQQNPGTSFEMFGLLRKTPRYDCIAAVPEERTDGAVLRGFKSLFYKVFNAMGDGIEITANASDFRVFKRVVADALIAMPEYYRFSKGLFSWVGFNTHTISYQPKERFAGESHWSFGRLFKYAIEGIVSFSTLPLKLTLYLGLLSSLCAIVYLAVVIGEAVLFGVSVPGYPTLACLVLLVGGVLMLMLGVFGEYLGRIYMEGKHRPIYIERERFSSVDQREDNA